MLCAFARNDRRKLGFHSVLLFVSGIPSFRFCHHSAFLQLIQGALSVLETPDPNLKAKLARKVNREWWKTKISDSESITRCTAISDLQKRLLIQPNQPDYLIEIPSNRMGSPKERNVSMPIWLLHSLAHVEYNAINLAFDMIVRWAHCYSGTPRTDRNEVTLPLEFYEDWLLVGNDEARHQWSLQRRLEELGSFYGQLPVHNNLWESARATSDNLTGRLVVIPLVQEARGLDAHPRMVDKLIGSGDKESSQLIDLICSEEIEHVQKGIKWFSFVTKELHFSTESHFASCVKSFVPGGSLLPPFNVWAREQAGMSKELYIGVSQSRKTMETSETLNVKIIASQREKYKESLREQVKTLDSE